MLDLRRVLGVLVPLAAGFVFSWLLDINALASEGPFTFITLLLVTTGLAGIVGGFLLRSWWAVAIVPIALVVGVLFGSLIRTGTIAQGPIEEVGPLAAVVLTMYLVPTALGALIGTAVGRWATAHDTHTTHASHA